MKMAFIAFEGMTSLDLIGFTEAVTWMGILQAKEKVSWDFCSIQEEITDDRGLSLRIKHVRPDLAGYDLIFIPGGMSTRQLRHDPEFVSWIRTAHSARYKVSVCTGALLLGAAGFLTGRRATTNRSAYELLAPYCREVVQERVVRDGGIFTGGGVSTSIDLGLFLVETLTSPEFALQVQDKMDYPYYRPLREKDR
ncbi:DJ-1/PfpI family protein [Paenibacillus lutrae]|uniref:DJ-1/PfpI family protein n=1 Tax=Paenibacillus lutrae TaxID=2078573 RepID=A0A7X3JYU7_9BACL|nr:DJ-1/PfpI family protein [Paenibacillus lutrae]MVO99513.1 DJ-1/PfpI family protein [Paenibacillus lutrae]